MATAPFSNIGFCPICSEPVMDFKYTDGSKYQFSNKPHIEDKIPSCKILPCGCITYKWTTTTDGCFVGGSGIERKQDEN